MNLLNYVTACFGKKDTSTNTTLVRRTHAVTEPLTQRPQLEDIPLRPLLRQDAFRFDSRHPSLLSRQSMAQSQAIQKIHQLETKMRQVDPALRKLKAWESAQQASSRHYTHTTPHPHPPGKPTHDKQEEPGVSSR